MLAQTLDALPRSNTTFLMTERGAPFTSASFGKRFKDRCDGAELPEWTKRPLSS
jgi:hypothetical protein